MPESNRTPRRRHSGELKRQVLAACDTPGASVARVALAHGLNANLVHKWRRTIDHDTGAAAPTVQRDAFIALTMTPSAAPTTTTPAPDIRIELRRGATAVNVAWPLAAASDCAAWLRELLR
jgi:transposase